MRPLRAYLAVKTRTGGMNREVSVAVAVLHEQNDDGVRQGPE